MLAEGAIAFEARLSDGLGAVDALGKDTPGDLLRNFDAGRCLARRFCEFPVRGLFLKEPNATTIAEDLQREDCAGWSVDLLEGVRQTADEAVENGKIEIRCHDAGAVGGFADLLLMMPALGEFTCGVEPVE
jgi:hypothetical protein